VGVPVAVDDVDALIDRAARLVHPKG